MNDPVLSLIERLKDASGERDERFGKFADQHQIRMSPLRLRRLRAADDHRGVLTHVAGGRPDGGVSYAFMGMPIVEDIAADIITIEKRGTGA